MIIILNFIFTLLIISITFSFVINYYTLSIFELNILYCYIPLILFTNINSTYGIFYLVQNNHYNLFNYSVIFATIIISIIYLILLLFSIFNFYIYLSIFVCSELLILLIRYFYTNEFK
jgi:hypothetical protein